MVAICWMDCSLHIYYVTGKLIITTNQPDVVIRFLMPGCVCYVTKKANLFLIPSVNVKGKSIFFCIQEGSRILNKQLLITSGAFEPKTKADEYFRSINTKNKFLHCGFYTSLSKPETSQWNQTIANIMDKMFSVISVLWLLSWEYNLCLIIE